MGRLVEGKWSDDWYDTKSSGGRFVRWDSAFRKRITADGAYDYPAEAGRYHLYVSYACPWAHRTLIFRKLKGLETAISFSTVAPVWGEGWRFDAANPDPLYGLEHLHQIYTRAKADYSGRVSVPVLWDKKTQAIVNNESSEIIRMLNSEFDAWGNDLDFYPEDLRAEIDVVNKRVYETVNNGVYRCGFATTQAAYEEAFDALFDSLDWLESRLAENRYLMGDRITEADWRLFTTLVRFDPVYVGHFKCNLRRIADYPNLWGYTRELYQVPGVAETVRMDHIKTHYYVAQSQVNPTGIVAKGPAIDFTLPHGRG